MDSTVPETLAGRIASYIVSEWKGSHIDTLDTRSRAKKSVGEAIRRRGLTTEVRDRRYAAELTSVMHHLIDQQHMTQSEVLPGSCFLDTDASGGFVAGFLPQIVPDIPEARCRLGFDGAGLKAGVQSTGSAISAGINSRIFGLTYATISHPTELSQEHSLVIAAMEPPETHARLSIFVALSIARLRRLKLRGYMHGDHGFYKKLLRIAGCPWCSVSAATMHLALWNTSSIPVFLDEDMPMVPGLLHYLCVALSALILQNDSPALRLAVGGWSAYDFDSTDYDSVSIKELTKLADSEELIEDLRSLLPSIVADAVLLIVDMRRFFLSRSLSDWDLLMEGLFLAHRQKPSQGFHIGWHVPAISRQLFNGSLLPLVEQALEHINQEFIFLRRRHNLYSTARLLGYRNAIYYPLSESQVLAILNNGERKLVEIRTGSLEELPAALLEERTLETTERLREPPICSYMKGHSGPGGELSLLIAVWQGVKVIGYAAALVKAEESLYIFDFYVAQFYRDCGIGSLLLKHFLIGSERPPRVIMNQPSPKTRSLVGTLGFGMIELTGMDVELTVNEA